MERLQGLINPCFIGDHLNVEYLDKGGSSLVNTEIFIFEEEEKSLSTLSFPEKMPFLQMLQSVEIESQPFFSFTEPNFHLQKINAWEKNNYYFDKDSRIQALELESCITHDISETHSPVKSEKKEHYYYSHSPEKNCREENSGSVYAKIQNQCAKSPLRKKRKRNRPRKNKEEVESQRMTHIAVERNRRRQMNDHLTALRSLMPTSFIQRGDQASIVGGAINFVKELEQLLQSLQVQKRMQRTKNEDKSIEPVKSFNGLFTLPQYTTYSDFKPMVGEEDDNGDRYLNEFTAENKSAVADIQVVVIQTHVNLKILSPRRPGQLLKAIASLEELRLTILHLNITSLLENSLLYSFNLRIEDDCKVGSADAIATAVHQIFSCINGQ